MDSSIEREDIQAMWSRLRTGPVAIDLVNVEEGLDSQDNTELEQQLISVSPQLTPEVMPQESDAVERLEEVKRILFESANPTLNTLSGTPFDSPRFERQLTDDPETSNEIREGWARAAKKDVDRIRETLIPLIGLDSADVDPQAALTPFVHQSWCTIFEELQPHGLQRQLFLGLGRNVLWLERGLHVHDK